MAVSMTVVPSQFDIFEMGDADVFFYKPQCDRRYNCRFSLLQHSTPVRVMIVLTGGAGFIGSAMAWKLNCEGIDDIIIVDRLGSDPFKWKNLRGLSFDDIWSPEELLARIDGGNVPQISAIIHMGACSSTTELDADYLLKNNYRFSRTLGEWALANQKRFIYASSAAVYGDGSHGFADNPELLPRFTPLNMYAYSKQLFDLHVLRKGWQQHAVGLRFFNIFGPNEYHKGPMRSMVLKAVEQINAKGEVDLFKSNCPEYADGDQVRDFLYVKDAVDLVWEIMLRPDVSGIYNVGSGITTTWNALITSVFSAMGKTPRIRYIDMPEDLAHRYQSYTCADMSAMAKALGKPLPTPNLEKAVHDYVTNYLTMTQTHHLEARNLSNPNGDPI